MHRSMWRFRATTLSSPSSIGSRRASGRVAEIAFKGNKRFNTEELLPHVAAARAHFLSRGRYDEKSISQLTAFYKSNGFNQVKVIPEFNASYGRDIVITFVVDEGPQDLVADLQVTGNTVPIATLAPDGLRIGADSRIRRPL